MKQYEYNVIANLYYLKEELLNRVGKDGWELVSHTYTGELIGKHTYTFKREKAEEQAKYQPGKTNEIGPR